MTRLAAATHRGSYTGTVFVSPSSVLRVAAKHEVSRRVAYAIVDVVTRYWIGYLLTSEMTSTQVQLLFDHALEDQRLVDPATGVLLGADGRPLTRSDDAGPILVAWSDIHTA